MADTLVATVAREKVVNLSVTVFERHHDLIDAIRTARAIRREPIPNKSDVVKQAIEALAQSELDPADFAELTGADSDALSLAS